MERLARKIVRIDRPFRLANTSNPAGDYEVTIEEEQLGDLMFEVFRRISTKIYLPPSDGRTPRRCHDRPGLHDTTPLHDHVATGEVIPRRLIGEEYGVDPPHLRSPIRRSGRTKWLIFSIHSLSDNDVSAPEWGRCASRVMHDR
jgi:hypothetical protein